jgi:hypothetical protein
VIEALCRPFAHASLDARLCIVLYCQNTSTLAETLRAGCCEEVARGPSVLLPEGVARVHGVDVACQSSLMLSDDDMALDRSPVECRKVACRNSLACGALPCQREAGAA